MDSAGKFSYEFRCEKSGVGFFFEVVVDDVVLTASEAECSARKLSTSDVAISGLPVPSSTQVTVTELIIGRGRVFRVVREFASQQLLTCRFPTAGARPRIRMCVAPRAIDPTIPPLQSAPSKMSRTNLPFSEFERDRVMSYSSSDSDEGVEHASASRLNHCFVFNDMIHPHLKLPSICHKIMNTPQFQRLRNLKQLGLTYHLYPSASHNRFEHCVGTSYLAGKYGIFLQKNQPELGVNEIDILCLYIAGLCHDLGHGPFSHAWEKFMRDYSRDYSHEAMSLQLLDYMIEQNGLMEFFEVDSLSRIDLIFIKEMILGHPLPGNDGFHGRGPEKYFLYQIVSNEETKIDVDKFDYLLRDSKQLNLTTAFDYERVIENSRVVRMPDGRMRIAYRKKIATCLEDLFKGRFRMHQMAYQHRVTKIIEEMVIDGLRAADPYLVVQGNDGTEYRLSTAYKDLSAFTKLTDVIFELILNKWIPCSLEAWAIFNNIVTRNLYKSLGFIRETPSDEAVKLLVSKCPNIILIPSRINYGAGTGNPLNAALFFEKFKPNTISPLEFSAPAIEEKYYIVLRPEPGSSSSSKDDLNCSSTSSRSEELQSTKKILKEWAAKLGLCIQME